MCSCGKFILSQGADEGEQEVVGLLYSITVSSGQSEISLGLQHIFISNIKCFHVFRVNKAKGLKRRLTGGPSTSLDACNNLQGSPAPSELSRGPDQVFAEGSNVSNRVYQESGVKESDTCSSSLENGSKLSVNTPPAHSLLDILADQALAHEYHAALSQELLAAVGKHWNFSEDRSPPLPPPPPQSSPVNFPESGLCPVVLPHLLQVRGIKHGSWQGME